LPYPRILRAHFSGCPQRGQVTEPYPLCRLFFFFQAEDGIRDRNVTGVQTCALPISSSRANTRSSPPGRSTPTCTLLTPTRLEWRSEERRVGKECRSRWAPDHEKKKRQKKRIRERDQNKVCDTQTPERREEREDYRWS